MTQPLVGPNAAQFARPLHPIRTRRKKQKDPLIVAILIYVAALPAFVNLALPVYTATQRLLAWGIFAVSSIPLIRMMQSGQRRTPLMPLLGAQYLVFYAFAIFFDDATLTLSGKTIPESSAIDMTLTCVLLSIIAIQLGYFAAGRALRLRFKLFQFSPSTRRLFLYAVATLVGAALLSVGEGTLLGWAPGTLSRPLSLILSVDVGVAILACLYYQDLLAPWQKGLAVFLVLLSVGLGFIGGMFQNVVQPLVIWAMCRWIVKGRIPVLLIIGVTLAFFILQPVKGSYRSMALLSGRNFSTMEKVGLYATLIEKQWFGTQDDPVNLVLSGQTSAKNRLSLLMATAHYVEWTPEPFDYRNGSTLGYPLYGWIPRALWPDKPIAQQANKILPVDYNFQSVTSQTVTMFGVGHVAEVYINFGILGIIPLFFVFGMLYRIPELVMGRTRNTATISIFVATAIAMAGIGSSVSDAFGGFVQQLLLQGLLLRLLTRHRPSRIMTAGGAPPATAEAWIPQPSVPVLPRR